ncbi:MAG: TonB-dependent receptor [Rhizobacter sp.]|nr:TonB-dependent receptor [Ferruginibacter sp.]
MTLLFKKFNTCSYPLLLLLFILPSGLFAQTINLKGTVTGSKGQSAAGVTVNVKGTGTNSVTTETGDYSISVPAGATLVFSSTNFETSEQKVGTGTTLNVSLKEKVNTMEDVVVIGYGTKRKRDLTGTVSTLGGEEVVAAKAQSVQETMQGRVAGVDVRRGNGRPGSDMVIEIRGANSIYGGTQPLYVVDGIVMGNINEINPSDIDRIDVLKDASSTAIFGSRGANGVVIVTTKRGVKGPPRISYDAYAGIVNPYNLPPIMDGPKFVNYAREFYNTQALLNGQPTPVADNKIFSATELTNITNGTYPDWIDMIKQNGLQTNHNLSITGGDEKMVYYLSAGYQLYQGALKETDVKRYTLKVGMDITPKKWLKFGGSIISNYSDFTPGSGEVFRSAYRLRPTGSPYNADGSKRFFVYEGESQITNPLFDLENEIRKRQYVKLVPNAYIEVNFLKDLKFRSSFTPDLLFQRTGAYYDMFSKTVAGVGAARGENGAEHWFNYTWDNTLMYNKQVGDHKFDITAGSSINYYQYDYNSISVRGLPFKSLWFNVGSATAVALPNGSVVQPTIAVGSGYSKQTLTGVFARANYGFKNKYLLTFTGRYDGNSFFAPGKQWEVFPSVGVAWIASEENFMQDIKAINLLKLRFAFGQSGNAAASGILYPYITQSLVGQTQYDFNGANANGFAPSRLADKSLSWEKTSEYNAGLELNVLNNRVSFVMDVYSKTVKGSILQSQIPPPNGFPSVITNLGSVKNSGIELGLNTQNIKTSKVTWNTSINFARNKNQIIDLFGDGKNDIGNQKFLGEKTRVIFNYKVLGVWQTAEAVQAAVYGQKPGQWKIEDYNNDKLINNDDRQINGSGIPDWFGGITNNVSFANFDFGITLYTRQGTFQQSTFLAQYMNGDQGRARFNAFDRSYWTPTNASNEWANVAIETDGARRSAGEYLNSSYTKISNMALGYTIPKSILGNAAIKRLRIYVDAYNPFIFTKFVGWDPETADANSFGDADFRMRTFMFGINLSF